MRTVSLLAVLVLTLGCTSEPEPLPELDAEALAVYTSWLDSHGQAPVDYLRDLFAMHDVVILGERHRIRHDLQLLHALPEVLHAAGVRTLATEFARREDQPLLDSLLVADGWDEALAREIGFRQSVMWGFQEYVDILRSAWTLNRALPADAAPFRVLGMNGSPDWSQVREEGDRNRPEVMRKVWRGEGEKHWAPVVLAAVASGEKVLVHCGMHHAFSKYRQPIVRDGEFQRFDAELRCGNHLAAALGDRVVTVALHAPWRGAKGYGDDLHYPAAGVIDAVMAARGGGPLGWNLAGGPFAEIAVPDAVYRHGYEDFRLGEFCDGWIWTQPFAEYEGVTPIADWFTPANLDDARRRSPNPRFRGASRADFEAALNRDAGRIERDLRYLR